METAYFLGRIEAALASAVGHGTARGCPPRLAAAIEHAVFPGGARLRPAVCLAVASACAHRVTPLAEGAAAAVELLHCASLVHDDLPCFDAAETRRGCPSVHKAFGEPTAVLAGDALVVLAFETLARAGASSPALLPPMVAALAAGVGARGGIIAGQAWESEPPPVPVDTYHQAKTGALFEAAAALGALSAGESAGAFRPFARALGRAYQAADDVADVAGGAIGEGKPLGRDAALGRPSLVRSDGLASARERARTLFSHAIDAVPAQGESRIVRLLVARVAARAGLDV